MSIVLITAIFAVSVAFVLGITLGFFKNLFYVEDDPTVTLIKEALPGANCGACGYPGCEAYAAAVAAGNASVSACTVGGFSLAQKIAKITGKEADEIIEKVAGLACQGTSSLAPQIGNYTGIKNCRGAKIAGGTKLCFWGCLTFGDCIKVCKFDALSMSAGNLPVVDFSKCTGCSACAKECPQGLFWIVEKSQKGARAYCANRNPVKQRVLKTCKVSCFKCGLCVKNCPQQCISLDTLIPIVDYSKCDSCGVCVEKCPSKVMKMLENNC